MKKRFIWLLLLPLIPIVLNYCLPLANWSRIGGKDSLSIWLNFWATFSNTIIFCGVTIFVLYKQIIANQKENEENRTNNEKQNKINRQHTLNSLVITKRTNELSSFIPVCSEYITLFDFDLIHLMKIDWMMHKYDSTFCQKIIQDRIEFSKKVWFNFKLTLSVNEDSNSFLESQEKIFNDLISLLSLLQMLFGLNHFDYTSKDGKVKILNSLKEESDLYPFFAQKQKAPYNAIFDKYPKVNKDIIEDSIQEFLKSFRENTTQIINGKTTNEKP